MSDIGKDFMRQTRYPHLTLSPQKQGLPQPPLQSPLPPDAGRIVLPKPEDLLVPAMGLRTAIEIRTSVRRYTGEALTLEELSYLLWCTQGVRSSTPKATFRNVPSAGARHAFETYLQINRVADLKPGIYRYAALEHELVEMDCSAETNAKVTHACHEQEQVLQSAVSFIWVAILERMFWRYVERGYRYLHLDAGHICQNLHLAAESLGCGVCAIAAFNDDELNQVLGLDGEQCFAVYAASLGKRIQKA